MKINTDLKAQLQNTVFSPDNNQGNILICNGDLLQCMEHGTIFLTYL